MEGSCNLFVGFEVCFVLVFLGSVCVWLDSDCFYVHKLVTVLSL